MRRSSRLQTRAMWARTPDNSLRVNNPDGFLNDFAPVPWDVSADEIEPGGWWVGSDQTTGYAPGGLTAIGPGGSAGWPSRPTTGSPLTRPNTGSSAAGPQLFAGLPPAVSRCTGVILNGIRSTPWLVETDGVPVALPQWIADPMGLDSITGPTGSMTPISRRLGGSSFWASVLAHAVWFGFGPFMFQENRDGQPIPGSLRLLNPYMVGVDAKGRFELLGEDDAIFTTDFDGRYDAGAVTYRLMALRGLPPNNGATPEGVLTRNYGLLRLGAVIHRWGERVFGAGVPSGFLKVSTPNMTQEDADKLKANWMKAHGGSRRSVAVLNAVTDYTKLSFTPQEMDTAALQGNLNREIALAFELDPVYVGEGASGLSYNNQNDRRKDLVDLTVAAWAQQLMDTITAILPLGTVCRVDWNAFTAPDIVEQGPVVMALHQAGLLSRDEARVKLGYPADDGPELVQDQVDEVVTDG